MTKYALVSCLAPIGDDEKLDGDKFPAPEGSIYAADILSEAEASDPEKLEFFLKTAAKAFWRKIEADGLPGPA